MDHDRLQGGKATGMERTEQAGGQDDVVEMAIRAIAHTFRERPHGETLVADTAVLTSQQVVDFRGGNLRWKSP